MTGSFTITESQTFTITHARHMAAKVATDLRRLRSFYGKPSDKEIAEWEAEVIELLKAGYLGTLTIGFRRNGQWIEPTLRYTARELGGIPPRANVEGASIHNYLTYTSAWDALSSAEQVVFKQRMPFQRTGAPEPTVNGRLVSDRTYSAGGQALGRAIVRNS
jgi:hypothetical protein